MPTTIKNKTTRANLIRQVKAGLTKYFGSTTLVLAGTSYKPAALQGFLQADVDANDASTAARANWLNTVKVAVSTDSETDPVLRAIKAQVMAQHGDAPDADTVLVDFGYAPRKKPIKTVEQKTAAVAQNKATREARGTKGPKAKAKIKGIVPATSADASQAVITTPAPAVTAPAPAPASNSASNGSPNASPNAVTTTPSHA